jgi:hypothetical protein
MILNSTGHYNSSASTSFTDVDKYICIELDDGSYPLVWLGNETFNIGGTSFSDMSFLQLGEFSLPRAPNSVVFSGLAGIFGLNFIASQSFEFSYNPSFIWAVRKYLLGELLGFFSLLCH